MNRAVNGDVVVVELLPEAEWKAPGEEVLDQDGKSVRVSGPCRRLTLLA